MRRRRSGGRGGTASCGGFLPEARVAVDDQDLLAVRAGLGDDPAKGVGQERAAPEFEASGGGPFVADAVHRSDVDAVGDRMGTAGSSPRHCLGRAELGFLGRVPADRRRIEEDLRALQRRQPGGFGIPLVPADQRAATRPNLVGKALNPRSPGVK